ncbi:Uncharacterised protein [BD1-7 clade bacterium]|uniref:Transmembrane anchor protein n=1 Tax=BD1-7 clade bacterium TaxID=2029982 RepID=A0A5S9N521_9GAMM|nr:Uncharacterised protein [BD1-7 clade bacterium]
MYNANRPNTDDLPSTDRLIKSTALSIVVAIVLLTTVVMPAEYGIDPTGAGRLMGLTQMGDIKQQLADEAAADAAKDASATAPAQTPATQPQPDTHDHQHTSTEHQHDSGGHDHHLGGHADAHNHAKTSDQNPEETHQHSAQPITAPATKNTQDDHGHQHAQNTAHDHGSDTGHSHSQAPAATTETRTVVLAPGEAAEIKLAMKKGQQVDFIWQVDTGHVNFDTHADAPGIRYHGYGKGRQVTKDEGQLTAAFDGKHGWFWRNRSDQTVTVTLEVNGAFSSVDRVL